MGYQFTALSKSDPNGTKGGIKRAAPSERDFSEFVEFYFF